MQALRLSIRSTRIQKVRHDLRYGPLQRLERPAAPVPAARRPAHRPRRPEVTKSEEYRKFLCIC